MKVIISIPIYLFFTLSISAQCYTVLYEAGISAFNSNEFNTAITKWNAAKSCPDKPADNDISGRINQARGKLIEIENAKRERAREKERQRLEQIEQQRRRVLAEENRIREQQRAEENRRIREAQEQAEKERLEELARKAAEERRLAEERRKQADNQAWEEAKKANTTEAFFNYAEKINTGQIPGLHSIDEINQELFRIWDDETWERYKAFKTLWSYQQFIKDCQKNNVKSGHIVDAKRSIAEVKAMMPKMVNIEGGSFPMGSEEGEYDEKPNGSVSILNFGLSKYEITVAEFEIFVKSMPPEYKTEAEKSGFSYILKDGVSVKVKNINWRYDAFGKIIPVEHYNRPVVHISWHDAIEYCQWLNDLTDYHFRLPLEAEWEYAAGNGIRHTKYSWGNVIPYGEKAGNLADEDSKALLPLSKKFDGYSDGSASCAPVGSFNPNTFGLYDMTGNVWEWCNDYYDYTYYKTRPSSASTPKGPLIGSGRVIRGGSWTSDPYSSRTTFRNRNDPESTNYYTGFRVATYNTIE
jgi:formylglycine-generating enzyme required for sulfatase activity